MRVCKTYLPPLPREKKFIFLGVMAKGEFDDVRVSPLHTIKISTFHENYSFR